MSFFNIDVSIKRPILSGMWGLLEMKGFEGAGIVLNFDKKHKIECHTKEEPHKVKSPITPKWNIFETSHKTPQDVKLICHESKSPTAKE